ncbi:MAG: anaerobic ribonucleoside-triphosphate reductase activating protein [Chitinivibrionales bacterium]|nr:anaerobic ribonucleoside-triphosphate reductase activating protein [Chitinivibrionales bacterium]
MPAAFINLAGWLKNSCIDFPGTVATVLFFRGCNLACPYCHNAALVKASGQQVPLCSDGVWDFLEKRRHVIGGVVLSGGEPTLYPGLVSPIRQMQSMGYKVKLDTNGLLPEMIPLFNPDYCAVDVKTAPALYQKLLRAPFPDCEARLKKTLSYVAAMGPQAEVRITCAAGIVSEEIIETVCTYLEGIHTVYLQRPHIHEGVLNPLFFSGLKPVDEESLIRCQQKLRRVVQRCSIRE